MKRFKWPIILVISLISSSAIIYLIQISIFKTPGDTLFYFLQDFAFIPIEVLFVTLILHRLLTHREKRALFKKLNMVIGAFFSETGTELLKSLAACDVNSDNIRKELAVTKDWPGQKFSDIKRIIAGQECVLDIGKTDLAKLKNFLDEKRNFLVSLLENPNLLEHESFTDMLWAVFHLAEELSFRKDTQNLGAKDREHLAGDMKRAYIFLISEWLSYMRHLKESYPYLFSLALRINPFDPNASPEIK